MVVTREEREVGRGRTSSYILGTGTANTVHKGKVCVLSVGMLFNVFLEYTSGQAPARHIVNGSLQQRTSNCI